MTRQPTRVLVLGATGHIGQAVVRHALDRSREVTALTRRANPESLRGLAVNVVQIDNDLRSLAYLAAGHDLMVDAAAPYPLAPCHPGSPQWQSQVDAAIARMEIVIEAARRNGMRLAYVSSCTTLPRNESQAGAAAAVWRRSITPYFEAKAAMEHAVAGAARKGLPAVIVNPAVFLGPWEFREVEGSFVRLVMEQRLPAVLNQMACVIDVRDVADAIDRALTAELYGHPIPLCGYNIGWPDLVAWTGHFAGLPGIPPLPLDPDLVSASVFWMNSACTAFGFALPMAMNFIPLIADSRPMERSPEQIALGVEIRPLEDTLRDSVAFHRTRQQM
jgi:dihydroflavonol-4-reductase